MTFDKKKYWDRRKKGLRGQGDKHNTVPMIDDRVTRKDGSIISEKRNPEEYRERIAELNRQKKENK